tara:strand:- start:59 stop:610 length:552 start_codon:yes stop_codon:yes gene_type:complete
MIKIKPKYVLEGCPIQISFDLPKKRTVLVFYGWKSFIRKSDDGIVLYIKKKKKKITAYYWNRFFFKKEKIYLNINTYKSTNINDLTHELSGAIDIKKNPIISTLSKEKLFKLKTKFSPINKNINKPSLVSKNPYSNNISSKINFENKIKPIRKNLKAFYTQSSFDNEEFENFKKQSIYNQQFI